MFNIMGFRLQAGLLQNQSGSLKVQLWAQVFVFTCAFKLWEFGGKLLLQVMRKRSHLKC